MRLFEVVYIVVCLLICLKESKQRDVPVGVILKGRRQARWTCNVGKRVLRVVGSTKSALRRTIRKDSFHVKDLTGGFQLFRFIYSVLPH